MQPLLINLNLISCPINTPFVRPPYRTQRTPTTKHDDCHLFLHPSHLFVNPICWYTDPLELSRPINERRHDHVKLPPCAKICNKHDLHRYKTNLYFNNNNFITYIAANNNLYMVKQHITLCKSSVAHHFGAPQRIRVLCTTLPRNDDRRPPRRIPACMYRCCAAKSAATSGDGNLNLGHILD